MSERSNALLWGGVRATVGVLVIGVAATVAVALNTIPLPAVERDTVAVTVDTLHGAEQALVCSGSFAELGADPNRPSVSLPTGIASVTVAGEISSMSELERTEAGGSAPAVLHAPAGDPLAAAQAQQVLTATLRGLTASSCAEPVNEQWLIGGATTLGISTTLSLGNASSVPATVQLTLYDENGAVDQTRTSGVLVPAGSERTVSLNGYAPGREHIAVRVVSTGAAVTASLGVAQAASLIPFAVDTVTRQLAPGTTLIVPGVTNISTHQHGPGDAGEIDPYPVLVRVLAPAGETGSATVRAVMADGSSEQLGQLEFSGSAVAQLPVAHWPEEADAVVIESSAPVIAAVQGSADSGTEHDYAWFAPAPVLAADTPVAAPVVFGGSLVLVNPGAVDAVVRIDAGSGQPREVKVPAGGAVTAVAAGPVTLTSSAPIAAGVRLAGGGDIAGYPILTGADRASAITVYPR